MSMNKKIISMVLALIMIFSVSPQYIFAEDEIIKSDIAVELFSDPGLTALAVIGVFDKNEAILSAEKPMTRREFAKLAVKLQGMENVVQSGNGKRYFYDVSVNDEYAPYIYAAASQGLIKPKQTNYFSPDAYVTKIDVANALINVLGYTLQLELQGVSEQSIISVAAKYGILDDIGSDDTFTSLDVYTMIKNALEVPVLEISSIGESVSFTKNKDLGILAVYHDIYEDYGIVTANSNTGLKRISDNTEPGYVKIGNELYILTEIDYSELLGHQIMFYYQEPQGKEVKKKLIYAEDDRTEVLKLTPDDIDKFENMTYHFWDEKDKLEKASVKNADIIYNDTAVENYSYDYIPKNGDVTLIDQNGDEKYEVIIINDYVDTVLLGTNVSENVLYFNSEVNVDLDDYPDARIINWPNMAKLDIKGFRHQHSISMAYGLDGEVKKIIAYFSDLVGVVSSTKSLSDNEFVVEINGKEYEFTSAFYENVEKKLINSVEIGLRGRFYLNYNGKIFDWAGFGQPFARYSKQFEVAIFDDIATEGSFESKTLGRFYTGARDFEVIEFAKKVLIDGKTYTTYDDIRAQMCINGEDGIAESEPVKQFVRIKFNEKGELIEIDKVGTKESGGIWKVPIEATWDGEDHFSNSAKVVGRSKAGALTRNTAVVTCPVDGEGNLDLSNVELMDYADPRSTVEYSTSFPLDVYRVGSYDPEAVLVHRKDVVLDTGSQVGGVFVVKSVKRKLDGNDNERLCVEVSENYGAGKTYYVDEEILNIKELPIPGGATHELDVGDVVRLYSRGLDLVGIQIIYDKKNDITYKTDANGNAFTGTNHPIYGGYAIRRIEDRVLFALGEPGEEGREYAFSIIGDLSTVSVYDSEEKKFYRGHLEMITDYMSVGGDCSKLFIRFDTQNDQGPKGIIIYQ